MTIDQRLSNALADRYRIEREIGAGGMATVYLAEDLKHHRKVAIKVLRPELTAVVGADRFARPNKKPLDLPGTRIDLSRVAPSMRRWSAVRRSLDRLTGRPKRPCRAIVDLLDRGHRPLAARTGGV